MLTGMLMAEWEMGPLLCFETLRGHYMEEFFESCMTASLNGL